jgi:hypothetical protein
MSMTLEHGPVRVDSRSPFTGKLLRCDGCGRELDIRKVCYPVETRIGRDGFAWKRLLPGSFCSPCANRVGEAATREAAE